MRFALRGQTLAFTGDPFQIGPQAALVHETDGAVIIENGRIVEVGPAAVVLPQHPGLPVTSHGSDLIMAGFVDCHVHYPQVSVIASYGTQLIDWLNRYTFPAERAFADPAHCRTIAAFFLDELLRNGTTSCSAYCTVHPSSVDALFEAAETRGMAVAAGKMMMDRNAPVGLLDTVQQSYDDSAALIARWHNRARARYVISPRFAPTSTPEQLEAAAALWRAHPTTLLQTHVSENRDEIAWVGRLFPDAADYVGVYERHGLLGQGANLGHAIHLSPREVSVIRESGSGISHCPTSNLFIGSGLFDLAGLKGAERPVPVGLGTDIGGGTSFSMFATMRAAYEIAQLRGHSLHPACAYWLATVGGATIMRREHEIGNLASGLMADLIVLDLQSTPLIAQRMQAAETIADALFVQLILADDRAIRAVYVAGERQSTGA